MDLQCERYNITIRYVNPIARVMMIPNKFILYFVPYKKSEVYVFGENKIKKRFLYYRKIDYNVKCSVIIGANTS